MSTPNELDRIVRSLIRQIEERHVKHVALQKECDELRAQCDALVRANLGFPPRRLKP
jgi:hypothetical protein